MAKQKLPGRAIDLDIPTYGMTEFLKNHSNGASPNMLRTAYCVQPKALRKGDMLATGSKIVEAPRTGKIGRILVCIEHKDMAPYWFELPEFIPIALASAEMMTH